MTVGVETVAGVDVRTKAKVTGMTLEKEVEAKVAKEAQAVVMALEMMGPSWVEKLTVEVNEMTALEVTLAQVEVEKMTMLLAEVVLVRKLSAEVVLVRKLSAEAVLERMVPAQVEMVVKKAVQERGKEMSVPKKTTT